MNSLSSHPCAADIHPALQPYTHTVHAKHPLDITSPAHVVVDAILESLKNHPDRPVVVTVGEFHKMPVNVLFHLAVQQILYKHAPHIVPDMHLEKPINLPDILSKRFFNASPLVGVSPLAYLAMLISYHAPITIDATLAQLAAETAAKRARVFLSDVPRNMLDQLIPQGSYFTDIEKRVGFDPDHKSSIGMAFRNAHMAAVIKASFNCTLQTPRVAILATGAGHCVGVNKLNFPFFQSIMPAFGQAQIIAVMPNIPKYPMLSQLMPDDIEGIATLPIQPKIIDVRDWAQDVFGNSNFREEQEMLQEIFAANADLQFVDYARWNTQTKKMLRMQHRKAATSWLNWLPRLW